MPLPSAPFRVPAASAPRWLTLLRLRGKTACWAATAGVLFLLWAVCTLRALPSYHRGTYATEGGAWLSAIWQDGFLHAVQTIRPDYCVLGNLCVIKAADALTTWASGTPLGAQGPFWQHTFAALYVALNFLIVFTILRRHHGGRRALLVTMVMLLAPDLDDENRVFGEANNVGFFSVLTVVFIYYDFWIGQFPGWRRTAASLALIAFHLLTSPLAGVVAAAFSGLLLLRLAWSVRKKEISPAQAWPRAVVWLVPVVLTAWILQRAQHHGPSAAMAAETAAAGGLAALRPFLIDYVLCRQWLYPLTVNFYLSASDNITLGVLALVLAGLGVWLWLEKRHAPAGMSWRKITGLLLVSGVALAVALVTLYSRRWLVARGLSYETLWPARYYLVQTMLMAGFFCLVLLRTGDLLPRFRPAAWFLTFLMGLNFALLQRPHLVKALADPDPAVNARFWAAQLGRVRDLHALTGDLPRSLALQPPALLDVAMYIEGHAVPVPVPLIPPALQDVPAKSRPDFCPVETADAALLGKAAQDAPRRLGVEDLRLIPRAGGLLLMADLRLPKSPAFAQQKRLLRLPVLPGNPALQAWAYSREEPADLTKSRRTRRVQKNWLFKLAVWWDHPPDAAALRTALTDLPVVLGGNSGPPIAAGVLLEGHAALPLSALRDDPTCALRVSPARPVLDWRWNAAALTGKNVRIDARGIALTELREGDFDEAAYLALNPDVQRGLDQGAITSGRAHFLAFGIKENRPFAWRSVSLDLAASGLESGNLTGLTLQTARVRLEAPDRFRVVLHGSAGQQAALDLVPPEGQRDFSLNFLPAGWTGPSFPLRRLELQFVSLREDTVFLLPRLTLTQRP